MAHGSATLSASVVVLTFNQLEEATRPCLESILRNTPEDRYELIVVDNASSDGTPDFLREFAAGRDHVRLVLNQENKGYAAGNNDGIRLARGDCVILLNNDTLVAPGWLDGLLAPLEADDTVGLVGPVTNSAGNEQRAIFNELKEQDYERFAAEYVARHSGSMFSPDRLGFFCVAIRREVIDRIGLLDEAFGVGMFEDDDYCLRAMEAGFGLQVTEGAFVYHKGSVSFSALGARDYSELFAKNKTYFMRKHGRAWTFSDMALSFWNKLDSDLRDYLDRVADPDPAVQRMAERLQIFRALLVMIRDKEALAEVAACNGGHSRWARRRRAFMSEFVRGSWAWRKRYVCKVLRFIATAHNRGS